MESLAVLRRASAAIGGVVAVLAFSVALSVPASVASAASPPQNDDFANATVIPSVNGPSQNGTNVDATREAGEPNHAGKAGTHSVWWTWTAPASGQMNLFGGGEAFSSLLAVYTGSSVATLTPVASAAQTPSGGPPTLTDVPVTGGTTYSIAIDSADGGTGHIGLSLGFFPTDGQGPGLLRVTTSPPVRSQITVDGYVGDTWGLQWAKQSLGSHQVCFSDVIGYDTPACQSVQVWADHTTTVTGVFVPRGTLHVLTSPAVPSQISVDGLPRDNWGMWTDFTPGQHQVCFGKVAGYAPPACQTITVTAGATTTVTGSFTASAGATAMTGVGLLRVTTSPGVPSQITLWTEGHPNVIADRYGLNWLQLPPGDVTVCFSTVEGYGLVGSCQQATITAGATSTVTANFEQRGYLRVITSPAVAGTISLWNVPADDWGLYTDVGVGTQRVCFGDVPGKVAPACQDASITPGGLTTITGTYT